MADGFSMRSGIDLGTALQGHPHVPSLLVYYRGPGATFGDEMERILGFLGVGRHPLASKTL